VVSLLHGTVKVKYPSRSGVIVSPDLSGRRILPYDSPSSWRERVYTSQNLGFCEDTGFPAKSSIWQGERGRRKARILCPCGTLLCQDQGWTV